MEGDDLKPNIYDLVCLAMKQLQDMPYHRKLEKCYGRIEEGLMWYSYFQQEQKDIELQLEKEKIDKKNPFTIVKPPE